MLSELIYMQMYISFLEHIKLISLVIVLVFKIINILQMLFCLKYNFCNIFFVDYFYYFSVKITK